MTKCFLVLALLLAVVVGNARGFQTAIAYLSTVNNVTKWNEDLGPALTSMRKNSRARIFHVMQELIYENDIGIECIASLTRLSKGVSGSEVWALKCEFANADSGDLSRVNPTESSARLSGKASTIVFYHQYAPRMCRSTGSRTPGELRITAVKEVHSRHRQQASFLETVKSTDDASRCILSFAGWPGCIVCRSALLLLLSQSSS